MRDPVTPVEQPTDRQIQVDVLNALDRDPLHRTSFGVTVSHGVVTLWGSVQSRREIWLAEEAVYETPGVLGIANELQVEQSAASNDSMITEAAVTALGQSGVAFPNSVKVIASNGFITLTGLVADVQRRAAAERAVRGLRGVRGVWNALMVVQPERNVPTPVERELCTI